MSSEPDIRDLSYANPDDPWWKRKMVHIIEALSGRHKFIPLYETWTRDVVGKSDRVMGDLLKLIEVDMAIEAEHWPPVLPEGAPLVLVANHPFGIGDGLAALSIAEQLGRPFKVMLNRDLVKVPEIRPYSLSVDFEETREAMKHNISTKKEALELLQDGWTIVIFPAGGVATAHNPWGKAEELPWKMFTARMIMSSKASVLPVYFEGQNSWLFHLVSRFSVTLRVALLINEFRQFSRHTCKVRVGEVIPFDELEHRDDRKALVQELYERVHELGEVELTGETLGEHHKRRGRGKIVSIRRLRRRASRMIPDRESLKRQGQKVRRLGQKAVDAIPEREVVAARLKERARRIRARRSGGSNGPGDRDAA